MKTIVKAYLTKIDTQERVLMGDESMAVGSDVVVVTIPAKMSGEGSMHDLQRVGMDRDITINIDKPLSVVSVDVESDSGCMYQVNSLGNVYYDGHLIGCPDGEL